jgi:hypothetical protein
MLLHHISGSTVPSLSSVFFSCFFITALSSIVLNVDLYVVKGHRHRAATFDGKSLRQKGKYWNGERKVENEKGMEGVRKEC